MEPCTTTEYKSYSNQVRQRRHSIKILQKEKEIPTELYQPICNNWLYDIKTTAFIIRHNCLQRCNGHPCPELVWYEYKGYPWFELDFLRLLGWGKLYKKFRTKREHDLLYRGMTETARLELIAGESKRK